jgi:hypothetical protein
MPVCSPGTVWYAYPYGTVLLASSMYDTPTTINDSLSFVVLQAPYVANPYRLPRHTYLTQEIYSKMITIVNITGCNGLDWYYTPDTLKNIVNRVSRRVRFNFPLSFVLEYCNALLKSNSAHFRYPTETPSEPTVETPKNMLFNVYNGFGKSRSISDGRGGFEFSRENKSLGCCNNAEAEWSLIGTRPLLVWISARITRLLRTNGGSINVPRDPRGSIELARIVRI